MSDLFSTNAAKLKIMEKTLFEESPEMMISLGLFFRWLAAVEIQLDRNLCHAIGLRDFEAYEIISTSHSIPNKVKRLEDALKKHGSKTSPELHARLGYLNETVVTVRNKLAHGFIFRRLNQFAWAQWEECPTTNQIQEDPNVEARFSMILQHCGITRCGYTLSMGT